jgi:hypothetical protein
MNILKPLLEKGYFPVQLPPGFTSVSFAAEIDHFAAIWDAVPEKNIPLTQNEKFSVARSSYFRRGTAIVNPISFYYLAKEIDNFWPQIQEHFQKSTLSRSSPNFGPSLRAINLPKF